MDLAKESDQINLISSPFLAFSRWWSEETVAVVTGANRGIGFSLVRRLAELGLTVVLTARDSEKGSKAAESLRNSGLRNVHFFRLDVSEPSSIHAFVSWFRKTFGALDILVNNAAVSFNDLHENSLEHRETVIKTNFYGAKRLTEVFLPLFRRSPTASRILNISSRLGSLNKVKNPGIRAVLADENLTAEQVEAVVESFLADADRGKWKERGWPEIWTDYAVSKLALNAYSRVLARESRRSSAGSTPRLVVNCYCPGFTRSSMTGGRGIKTTEEAADMAARLILLPPEKLATGKFYVALGREKIISKL